MSSENVSDSIPKAVLSNNFVNGVALNSNFFSCKKWRRRRNVTTPEQMDLNRGTLNYEGISFLNKVEAAP